MKKILLLFLAISTLTTSFAASSVITPTKKATEIYLSIGKNGEQISLMDFTQISVKDYETISGRQLKLFEKAAFKLSQKKLARCINHNGVINNKRLMRLMADGSTGFHLGGFALGFFLGLIGVLIAYVANNNENKPNRVKWAWIGLGVSVLLTIILVVAFFNTVKHSLDD